MMRRHIVRLSLLAFLIAGVSIFGGSTPGRAGAQGTNLLDNPSFEQPFVLEVRADGGGFVAHGWSPWWYNDAGDEYDGPEFKQANIEVDPNRVRSGEDAQQYFRPWARHLAGLYQQAQVPANSRVQFTIYGHAWSAFCRQGDDGLECDPRNSHFGDGANPISMKIGIDPTGGTDPFSDAIVWSAERAVYDNYELFSVEATAQGDRVTVFVYSSPLYPAPVVNVYWDDAALVVVGEGSADTPPPPPPTGDTGTTTSGGVGTIPTQPPREDGSQWHVVQAGETLGGIALAYGVETQTIRDLNNLTSDIVYVGQELLIRPAPSEAEATPGATEEAGETTTPEPTPTVEVEATPEPETGQICLALFDDSNENGLWDEGETLLAGGTLSLEGVISDSYVTDGVNEPHCFTDLEPGDYLASVTPPESYRLTGLNHVPITLSGSGNVTLSFGAAPGEAGSAGEAEPEASVGESEPAQGRLQLRANSGLIITLAAVAGVLVLATGGGAFAYFTIYKRQAGEEDEEEEGEEQRADS
ncbi:MAG TPA: LysM peptidoglycan-binding domain-containing protein [Chloroflexi bacterium]|nr:LysM peptidoglycan-binding domain-containing protein [Chloroflexota bacterium]